MPLVNENLTLKITGKFQMPLFLLHDERQNK